MFSHIVVGADDLAVAKRFYDAALGPLGSDAVIELDDRLIYSAGGGILMVRKPIDGGTASFGNGVTVGMNAPDIAAVDAFHQRGLGAGGSDAGEPGPRDAIPNSYAAYLRDPTGNKLVAWCVRAA